MELENICFKLKTPQDIIQDMQWVLELSQLRAQVFYAKGPKGPRTAFKLKNGEFHDPDIFDKECYHVLAFEQTLHKKKLVGALRLLPLRGPEYHCVASEIVGVGQFKKIVHFFNPNMKLMEVNRFFVREEYQHHVLGMNLCATAWWLGHSWGYNLITNGNIKLVEALYVKYLGGVLFPEYAGPYRSELYNDDEIYILYIDKNKASSYLLEQVEIIKTLLPGSIPTIAHEVAIAS